MRTFIAQHPVDTVNEHTFETKICDTAADVIAVDEFSVSKNTRDDTETLLNLLLMFGHLELKFVTRYHTSQRVVVCLGKKLDRSGVGQSPETLEYFGRIGFELFDRYAGKGKCDLDLRISFNAIQQ